MGQPWTDEEDRIILFYYLFTSVSYADMVPVMIASDDLFPFHEFGSRVYNHNTIERRISSLINGGHWARGYAESGRIIRYMRDHNVRGYFQRMVTQGKAGLEPTMEAWNKAKKYHNNAGPRGKADITRRTISDLCYEAIASSHNDKHSAHPRCWRDEWIDAFIAYYANEENDWEDHSAALTVLYKAGFPPKSKLKFPMTIQNVQASRDYWISWCLIRGPKANVIRDRNIRIRQDNQVIGYKKDGMLVERYSAQVATEGQLTGDASDIHAGESAKENVDRSNLEEQIINVYFGWT
ncbi:MAG: hypothetical protein MMC33_009130 [Icmadophila ericetorum]|nr:hypothetical protein [Icmadophila ericetorum]